MIIKKLLKFIILIVILIQFFSKSTYAQTVIFQDDFEDNVLFDTWNNISGIWNIENFHDTKWASVESGGGTDNEIQIGSSLWSNYKFNVKIYRVSGSDINLFFRIQEGRYTLLSGHNLPYAYGLHLKDNRFALQKFTTLNGIELVVVSEPFPPDSQKNIQVQLFNNNIKIFVEGRTEPIIDYIDISDPYLNGGISLGSITGGSGSHVLFDDFIVSSFTVEPSSTPTSTATPIPTEEPTSAPTNIPTATPILTSLSVLDLKQYSEPWRNEIYGYTKNTIHELGCALTSVSMVLQYYGHVIFPDELNNWLKNQTDGYIRNGYINWLAVSRYTFINDSIFSPTLEYKRISPTTENLDNELINKRPAILKEPGHFVVGTGKLTNTYSINDPGYSDKNTLLPYNNSFLAINSYTPSHTDLSYIMFVGDQDLEFKLFDIYGNAINPDLIQTFKEDPIINLMTLDTNSEPLSIFLFPRPALEKYILKVTGNAGEFNFEAYLYDKEGNVFQKTFKGIIISDEFYIYNVNYTSDRNVLQKNSGLYKSIINKSEKFIKSRKFYDNLAKQIENLTPKLLNPEFSLKILQKLRSFGF